MTLSLWCLKAIPELVHLMIIHISCCEQFHAGDIFFLPNYTCSLYQCAEGAVHLLMDGMLVL